jgi:RNA polymerase sigma-70 factor (ECF subfamily)
VTEPLADDRSLVRRCLAGEDAACELLLDLYRDRVFSLLCRLTQNPADAEDLAQETFLKAFRNLAQYDLSRPLLSWLFAIAHNTAMDFHRARNPALVSLDAEEAPLELPERTPRLELAVEASLRSRDIELVLSGLPPLYREILVLRHQEELDYAEIGRILELPSGTVKNRLFRAREKLRAGLEAAGLGVCG